MLSQGNRCEAIGIWRPPAVSSVPVHISTSVTANRQRRADRDTRNSVCGCPLFLKNSPLKYEDLRHDGCPGQELGALPPTPCDFSHKGTVHAHGEGRDIHRTLDRVPCHLSLHFIFCEKQTGPKSVTFTLCLPGPKVSAEQLLGYPGQEKKWGKVWAPTPVNTEYLWYCLAGLVWKQGSVVNVKSRNRP